MKSIIIYLLLFSISFSIVRSQDNKYLSFNEGLQGLVTGNTLPERSVSVQGAVNIELEYQFPGALISQIEVGGDIYDFLHIEGFSKMLQIGAPALPAHNEIIAMPVGAAGNIKIMETQYYEYEGFMIHPALEPARDTEGAPEPEFQKDDNIYNSDEFFPKDIVDLTDILLSRESPLALTQIRPVQFNPVTGIIRVYTLIRFRVDFIGGEGSFNSIGTANSLLYTNLLKRNVINSSVIPDGIPYGESVSRSVARNYIIITHSEYLGSANDLANWKRQLGYTVEVVSKSVWTASDVKDSIHNRYNNWTPKPDYFLILGDHDGSFAVPGEILYTNDYPPEPFASDLYFACMGGSGDWVPDMAHGRIAVSLASEAQVVVDKIIDYEKTPVSDASFYQNGLSCAQYQDDDDNGYADRRFCHTSEDIRDYLQNNHGYTSERVYYTNTTANVTTLRYNNGSYSSGQLLPAELRSLSFDWNGGSTDITNAIDAGKFMVFHRDHGYVGGSGWAHPFYTTSSMQNLTNGSKLPVVFSINCHTGEFQLSNCFAEKFLRMSGKGAVGVVAAAYYSYSGLNDALAIGMIDAIWSDPGLYPVFGWGSGYYTIGAGNDIYTMGDVVNQGLYAMIQNWGDSRYQHELFHWFGDPAMKIWIANPNDSLITATHASTIDCAATSFSITGSTAGAIATLVYNNELIGQTVLDASGNGTITYAITTSGAMVTLTVSKLHHKPYHSALNITGPCSFPPDLTTNAATGITICSAFGNGDISNDWGSSVIESGIVFSESPDPEIGGSGVTKVQTSPLVTTGPFSIELLPLSSFTVYYFRAYAINANGTGYGYDMSFTTLSGPITLPWTEDWEDAGGTTTFTADESTINGVPEWSYDMVDDGGRLRFEAGSGFYHGGSKAATLDRYPDGTYNTNFLIAEIHLANYTTSTSLSLSFYYMHHGEEPHLSDRVWIRGSDTNVWVEMLNLNTFQGSPGNWNYIYALDIDAILAGTSPPQIVSSTSQICFGQQDNFPATSTTNSDGFTFDDIVIDGEVPGLWIGTSSADWSSTANWSDGNVPDETDDVIIPEGLSNYPLVNDDLYINSATGNCRCHSLTIQNGAQLTINQGYQLIVNGNVTIEPGGVLHTGN